MAAGFTFKQNTAGKWYWILQDDNGRNIADATQGDGYEDRRDAEHGATLFTKLGPDAPEREVEGPAGKGRNPDFEYYEGADALWYWHFEAANGKVVADGSEGYDSKSNVLRAIRNVKDLLRRLRKEGGFEKPKETGPVEGGRFA